MMRVLLLLSALVACALGHAVMTSPTPLNTNPTTARPCGVSTLPANPSSAATWSVGQQTTVGWRLVASDGGKTVSGVIDPTGTGNFNADNTALVTVFTDLSTPSLGNYDRTFAVPNVACAGAPNGLCLFRMTSETNWNSCTYVNITDCPDCPPPPPPTPKCTPANGNMGFCFGTLNQNQIQVYILPGQTPTQIMADLRIVYNANLNNTNVFLNGNDSVCREAYRTFLCALDLPPCPGSDGTNAIGAACKGMCEKALESCQVNPLHEALYDCTTLPECPGTSSASTLIASGAVMATAVAAMLF